MPSISLIFTPIKKTDGVDDPFHYGSIQIIRFSFLIHASKCVSFCIKRHDYAKIQTGTEQTRKQKYLPKKNNS
jgi:hypothetical protein